MTKLKEETIKIQIGEEVVELTGEAKQEFIFQREADNVAIQLVETEYKAKQEARDSAIKKLGEIAGLTKEELNAIL